MRFRVGQHVKLRATGRVGVVKAATLAYYTTDKAMVWLEVDGREQWYSEDEVEPL